VLGAGPRLLATACVSVQDLVFLSQMLADLSTYVRVQNLQSSIFLGLLYSAQIRPIFVLDFVT
jgi:hypothetical protein